MRATIRYAQAFEEAEILTPREPEFGKIYGMAKKFEGLKTQNSREEAARIICMCASQVCDIRVRYQKERLIDQKLLISYDNLTKYTMHIKDHGYSGSTSQSARLFGFYLTLLIITGLRNRTVREAKFDSFRKITRKLNKKGGVAK
jgi:hypothetical protein